MSAKSYRSGRLLAAMLGTACLTSLAGTQAHAQGSQIPAVSAANNAVQSAIQSEIQIIRDQIQSRRLAPAGGRPLGFAGEPFARETHVYDPFEAFGALGYAKSPLKAPPAPPASSVTV